MKFVVATILVILALPAILLASAILGVFVSIGAVVEAIDRMF